jgi:hypothetical protein
MMRDTRVRRSFCLHCGKELDCAMHFANAVPNQGDFTVCIACGHLMVFGKKMRLRNPNRAEQIAIAGNPKLLIIQKVLAAYKESIDVKDQEGREADSQRDQEASSAETVQAQQGRSQR